jgi:iron complex transport system substrate-binding protein
MTGRRIGGAVLWAALLAGCVVARDAGDGVPRRIVAQLPNLAEAAFAMGLGDRVVGVSDFVLYPPEAAAKPRVGGVLDPNRERILSLAPDLALLHSSQTDLAAWYRARGIRTLLLSDASVASVLASFREIGRVCGVPDRAEALAAQVAADLDAVRARAAGTAPVKTLLVIGHEPGSLRALYVAAPGSFHDALLRVAGGVNAIGSAAASSVPVSTEEVLRVNPEAILMLYGESPASAEEVRRRIALWTPLAYVDAVRRGRVAVLSADYVMIAGPRMGRIAADMERALHPDAGRY